MQLRKNAADLEELSRLVDEGVVEPRPVRVMTLAEARAAQDLLQSGHRSEKVVLAVV